MTNQADVTAGAEAPGDGTAPDGTAPDDGADVAADHDRAAAVGMVLAHWAHVQPDVAAVASPLGDRTFFELNAEANRLVRALRARGASSGDAVAVMVANRPEFAAVLAATQRAGLRVTPINWHLTADEVAYIVGDCEAQVFVADTRFADVAAEAARQSPDAQVLLAVGGEVPGF
jgi:long-chain acyl-CoA synthetase